MDSHATTLANRGTRNRYDRQSPPRVIDDSLVPNMRGRGFTNVNRAGNYSLIVVNFTMPAPNQMYNGHITYHFDTKGIEGERGGFHIVIDLPNGSKMYYRIAPIIRDNKLYFTDIEYYPRQEGIYGKTKPLSSDLGALFQHDIDGLIMLMNVFPLPMTAAEAVAAHAAAEVAESTPVVRTAIGGIDGAAPAYTRYVPPAARKKSGSDAASWRGGSIKKRKTIRRRN